MILACGSATWSVNWESRRFLRDSKRRWCGSKDRSFRDSLRSDHDWMIDLADGEDRLAAAGEMSTLALSQASRNIVRGCWAAICRESREDKT